MSSLVSALLSAAPSKSDTAQTPAWLNLLETVFSSDSPTFPTDKDLETGFKTVFSYLESSDISIRASTSVALAALLSHSLTHPIIEAAVAEHGLKKPKSPLGKIVMHVRTSLDALSYARAVPQMLAVLASFIRALRFRPPASIDLPRTAAEHLLLDLVQKTGELRVKKGFEHKEAADEVLKAAMSVLGPEVLFRVLPLRLMPEDRCVASCLTSSDSELSITPQRHRL